MSTFQSLEEARAYFKHDTFATGNGMEIIEIGEGSAVCRMKLDERHRNAEGGVMGGVIFTLGDFAFAVATNGMHRPTVAMQVSINFLSAPKGSTLIAKARKLKDGRASAVYAVSIEDGTGRHVAEFIGTGFKL